MRTSSRSPKDSALSERGVEVYKAAYRQLKERSLVHADPLSTEVLLEFCATKPAEVGPQYWSRTI